jgi:preprotein translocase subunit SecY
MRRNKVVVSLHNLKNIFAIPDLRKKLGFVFAVLVVFRFGHYIPIPGVDAQLLKLGEAASGFLSYLDMVSGGALQRFSIFALGITPYISASIMMQLLSVMIPSLEAISKEGQHGRNIINQYTRYVTLGLSLVQGYGYSVFAEANGLVSNPGFFSYRLPAMLIVSTGALFVMWMGEQISEYGIGNGSSILIFSSIVSSLPFALYKLATSVQSGELHLLKAGLLACITLAVIVCVIFLEKGQRKIPVNYARRMVGNKMYEGQSSYIPLKINISGVIPVIFAGSTLNMPLMLVGMAASRYPNSFWQTIQQSFMQTGLLYNLCTVALIVFFSFFYTAVIFNPVEIAENLRKSGGFVPGIRPGKRTADFFDYVLTRVGFPGALYLAMLAVIPTLMVVVLQFPSTHIFSGISMLILVGVALDTSAQIESQLIERRYDGFLGSGRLSGRSGR